MVLCNSLCIVSFIITSISNNMRSSKNSWLLWQFQELTYFTLHSSHPTLPVFKCHMLLNVDKVLDPGALQLLI